MLDEGPDSVRIHGRDRDPDFPNDAVGKSLLIPGELLPRLASVGTPKEPTPHSAGRKSPGHSPGLPKARVHQVRIARIERKIDAASPSVTGPVQDEAPALTPIGGLVDAPLGIGLGVFTESGGPGDVAVLRMDTYAREILPLGEPDVPPGLTGIRTLVEAVALLDITTQFRLSCADIDDIRIGLAHRDRTHGRTVDLPVCNRIPRLSSVGGFPQSTPRSAEVVLQWTGGAACHGLRTPTARGADVGPFEGGQERLIEPLGRQGLRGAERADENGEGERISRPPKSTSCLPFHLQPSSRAMASISMPTLLGNAATSTVARAGR